MVLSRLESLLKQSRPRYGHYQMWLSGNVVDTVLNSMMKDRLYICFVISAYLVLYRGKNLRPCEAYSLLQFDKGNNIERGVGRKQG